MSRLHEVSVFFVELGEDTKIPSIFSIICKPFVGTRHAVSSRFKVFEKRIVWIDETGKHVLCVYLKSSVINEIRIKKLE